jgi:hypothetical protein
MIRFMTVFYAFVAGICVANCVELYSDGLLIAFGDFAYWVSFTGESNQ